MNRRPPESVCREILSYSNLTVTIPSLMYMLGMKLESARDHDIEDAGTIIKSENLDDVIEVFKALKDMSFQTDISLLLEAFEIAYGEEWLTNYLEEHLEDLRNFQ